MPSLRDAYPEVREALATLRGSPSPPTGAGDFAAVVTAFFARSLSDRKAREAWDAIREAGLESPEDLSGADLSELTEATRGLLAPSKTVSAKVLKPLQRLARWITEQGGPEALRDAPTEALRDGLLAIQGIGQGTADALLLHGWGRPVYPVDRATYRIFARHGWIDPTTEYDDARATVEALEPGDPHGLSLLASQFAEVGQRFCKPARPHCETCPLRPFLPESGPYEAGE